MHRFTWNLIAGLALLLTVSSTSLAQSSTPRIAYVYPAGGRAGTTFRIEVAGQFLTGTADAYISGTGVSARVIDYNRPLTVEEAGLLEMKLEALQEKKTAALGVPGRDPTTQPASAPAWTADDEKMLADIRKRFATFIPKNQVNPAVTEIVTLEITIAADAEPGLRDLRLRTPPGLSNPRLFCIAQLPEFSREPARTYRPPKDGKGPNVTPQGTEMALTLPAVANGQIMPGGANRFRFPARRGQRLVCVVSARELIPFLADAVPGWFQASLTLLDTDGKELASGEQSSVHPDPVLCYEVPKDGEYVLRINDALYRGREDFVYRLCVGEIPFITGVFPLGGPVGAQVEVEITGWNLPVNKLTMDLRGKPAGIEWMSVRTPASVSNRMPFLGDSFPECLEVEPNNEIASAQAVKLPVAVNGRIDKPGDWDVFRFDGRAGQEIVAEVYARRLNSPLDSYLKLTDASGKVLAFNDDHEDKGSGFNTHHADSYIRFTLPANGPYHVHIGDAQGKGGPNFAYRLRIGEPRPDFELRVVPPSLSARPGAAVPIMVHALRKDGFSGEITLGLTDVPAGFALSGGRVPADQDKVRLTVTFPAVPQRLPVSLKLEGRATIQGRQITHAAVPAEDMMQAFSYRHLVPVGELSVVSLGRLGPAASAKFLDEIPLKIPVGGTCRMHFEVDSLQLPEKVQLELMEAPEGLSVQAVSAQRGGLEVVIGSEATKVKAGMEGNLVLNVFAQGAPTPDKTNPRGARGPVPLATLPAVPFRAVAK